jgi:hypothetical protein
MVPLIGRSCSQHFAICTAGALVDTHRETSPICTSFGFHERAETNALAQILIRFEILHQGAKPSIAGFFDFG